MKQIKIVIKKYPDGIYQVVISSDEVYSPETTFYSDEPPVIVRFQITETIEQEKPQET